MLTTIILSFGECYTQMSYIFRGGFRLVTPYLYAIRRGVKLDWMGRKINEVLSEHFQFLPSSERELQQVFLDGRVKVDGRVVEHDFALSLNEIIELQVHMHEPEVLDRPIRLLHVDDDVVVVNKPSSIPVHPVGRFRLNTVLRILRHDHPELEAGNRLLGLVHRIDRQTSGLLVLARNHSVASRLTNHFVKRRVRKEYLARVKGVFPKETVVVDQPIEQVNCNPPFLFRVSSGGRRAVTVFERESVSDDERESIVRCTPVTGRTHQIRVHLQWLGHPISNDFKYGGDLNVNDSYSSSVPKPTGYEKVPWCLDCLAGQDSMRVVPLVDTSYTIYLHSLLLTCTDLNNSWTFEAPKPSWANFPYS